MNRLIGTLALLIAPAVADAQVATVDEGSFTIFHDGVKLGHEDFRIRRMPVSDSSAEFVASAVVSYGDRRLAPDLRTGTRGEPIAYSMDARTGAAMRERLSGRVGRGRFSAVMQTPDGESSREYALGEGAVILDDEIFHQYYFVAPAGRTGLVPVVVPRRGAQSTLRIDDRGAERLTVGGASLAARHVLLRDSGGADREIWVDAKGRVLKVSIAARGLVAVRDDAPPP